MGKEVAIEPTPLSETQIACFLFAAYRQVFNAEPSSDEMAGAWAQVAIETGRGKAMKNHNFGNLTTSGNGPDYYAIEVNERVHRNPDVWKKLKLKFVSFDNALAGARGYWTVLSARYAAALELFRQGEFSEAANKLSALGYFTAPVESSGYKHMAELAEEFKTKILPNLNLDSVRDVLVASARTRTNVAMWPLWLGLAALGGLVGWQVYSGVHKDEAAEARRMAADRELAEELRVALA
jgi:hypothetical protein